MTPIGRIHSYVFQCFFFVIGWNSSTSNFYQTWKRPDSFRHHFEYVCDERIAEIPSDHKKIQISYRKKERSVGIAKHSIIFTYCRNTEKRYPYVTKAAVQQQHSSSSAEAQQKQQRRRWWRWRRRRWRRRRQHGKPFLQSCRSSTVPGVVHKIL